MKTKKSIQFTSILVLAVFFSVSLALPASAISEADVQAQVDAVGRETVTGNVLIWFLCAIGFLKAAQKIDSFMASLGVNVGHTGGSMLAEALIAARGVGTIAGAMGHSLGAVGGHRGSSGGNAAAASAGGFFKGGLIGMARRKATVLPLSSQFHLDRIRLGQIIPDSGKADQMVMVSVGAAGVFRDHHIGRFHPKDGKSTCLIVEEYAIKCRYKAHF